MLGQFSRVLITGTTSGLGLEFSKYYRTKGAEVLSINRRITNDARPQLDAVLDITDPNQVASYLRDLKDRHSLPDLFLLNAGINRPDNVEGFDLQEFNEVWRINVLGVLNFLSAMQELHISGRTIAVLSSTSNIVPNPGHLGYFASKLLLHELFQLFAKRDRANQYKSVILGPVHTNIMKDYPAPQGLQGKIFNWLATTPEKCVPILANFFESRKTVLYYTRTACVFYFCVKWLLKVWPQLYVGTSTKTQVALPLSESLPS